MKTLTRSLVYALCAAAPLAMVAFDAPRDDLSAVKEALDTAIDDERHAIAFYDAVMGTHGERPPFSNIINAERRHEGALLAQYERLGLEVPKDRWADHVFDVPDRFALVCDAAAVAEVRNGRLYAELIEGCEDEEVRAVFERLRWASLERHLRAFKRHGSGWDALDPDSLSGEQGSQREAAARAQQALFAALFSELSKAMNDGGPTRAIDVCATRAPEIAQEVSLQHDLRIGRTSFRLRNPDNTAPVWAQLAIDERPEGSGYFSDRSGRLGALTPIRVAAACVQCHGSEDDIAPETRAAIARRYDADEATGFAEGDLRGWFWIEVPPMDDGD